MHSIPFLHPYITFDDSDLVTPIFQLVDLGNHVLLALDGLVRADDPVAYLLERGDVGEDG
jgi:hypothetical protein